MHWRVKRQAELALLVSAPLDARDVLNSAALGWLFLSFSAAKFFLLRVHGFFSICLFLLD